MLNKNPWVKTILSWHGHDRGGVHVPFQSRDKPLSSVIVTGVVARLRALAKSLAQGDSAAPRWIFLIGGPGNGKSETVEDFLSVLDQELGMSGSLIQFLGSAFLPSPLVPRRVEVNAGNFPAATASQFNSRISRLVVVQDATATDAARGDAAKELADDITDLVTYGGNAPHVFLACVNRGLLSRALRVSVKEYGANNDVTQLITALLHASSLGSEALTKQRPSCWPLDSFPHVACWPMDLESLLERPGGALSPVEQILTTSTDVGKWEILGACMDCDAALLCPFRQNADWIRQDAQLNALRTVLRRGELASGQRWNFRDTFSLAANLIVGEWSDFDKEEHPCEWVHNQVQSLPIISNNNDKNAVLPLRRLVERLYPHAIFPAEPLQGLAERYIVEVSDWSVQPVSKALVDELVKYERGSLPSIRQLLLRDYAALDPALWTPPDVSHPLYAIEMEYNQSVAQGNAHVFQMGMAPVEARFLAVIATAESEWDLTDRNAAQALHMLQLLRRLASIIAKRSVGTRIGHHGEEKLLQDYEHSIRDMGKLGTLQANLHQLLGQGGFKFNAVESFGQPRGDSGGVVTLQTGRLPLNVIPAPSSTPTTPAHDVPCFAIQTGTTESRVPITFTFFRALRLLSDGCVNSSLPASVRASIDRVRHLYAGELCRNRKRLVDGTVEITFGTSHKIHLDDENSSPYLVSGP